MPWTVQADHPDCDGFAVVDPDGKLVDGGCHDSKPDAEAHQRALYANTPEGEAAGLRHFLDHLGDADTSAWDGNAAMSACSDAACYRAICAGRKAGPPDQRSSWALPHHKTPGGPPNAAGVRAALARFSSTQGLTNAGAARRHLEAHMASISSDSDTRLEDPQTTSADEVEELATAPKVKPAGSGGKPAGSKPQKSCPPGQRWDQIQGKCVSATGTKSADEDVEALDDEDPEALGGKPNPGTDPDMRKTENRKRRKKSTSAATESKIEPTGDGAFEAILVIEGIPTGDGREFAPGSLSFADFPLPLTYQPPTHGGEPGPAIDVGVIEEAWRDDTDSRIIRGRGRFDMADPGAADVYRKVTEKFLKGTSVDVDDIDPFTDVELVWPEGLTEDGEAPDGLEALFVPPSRRIFHKGRIRGAAVLSMPAFVEAQLWAEGTEAPTLPDLGQLEEAAREEEAVTAAAVPDLPRPPREWFQNPSLGMPVPITVDGDGRVYGHAATWGTCHVGYGPDRCVTPPREDNHPYFTQGEVLCADGSAVAVGQITVDTGHADLTAGWRAAAAHYDDTGTAVADVAVGNDRHGIWVAGAVRPDAPARAVAALRASGQVSGDWRRIGGSLRLVGLLAVNVPGFPVPRPAARVASGMELSLVAAGMPDVGRGNVDEDLDQRALRQLMERALADVVE